MNNEQSLNGQDGIKPNEQEKETLLRTFEHPINCDKIEYTPEPLPINMQLFKEEDVT
jgi:hypothetical protein